VEKGSANGKSGVLHMHDGGGGGGGGGGGHIGGGFTGGHHGGHGFSGAGVTGAGGHHHHHAAGARDAAAQAGYAASDPASVARYGRAAAILGRRASFPVRVAVRLLVIALLIFGIYLIVHGGL
jgi:hypothetical protein